MPEIKAYFRIDEDYETKTAFYSLYKIDSNENDKIPQEYWKYNVSKPLSDEANFDNYKGFMG